MKRPTNLLILCSDELRGDCLGCMGNPDLKTPHIDALAQRGMLFRKHFATFPKCVPSRISLVTGRYTHTDGYRTITQHMPPGTPNLLDRLKERGYETALFGKNHCWDPDSLRELFDHLPSSDNEYREIAKRMAKEDAREDPPGGLDATQMADRLDYLGKATLHHRDEIKTEQAIEFLERGRDRERPFFLQVNIEAPHPMYATEEPWFSMYDRKAIQRFPSELPEGAPYCLVKQREVRSGMDVPEEMLAEMQAVYYGMVSRVDDQMGRILEALDRSGERENTLILFWSDHGDYASQYGLPEKWDTSFADCLEHVPCILAGPGVPEGKETEELSDHSDLAPTLLELLGLDPLPGVHGHSMTPLFEGRPIRDAVFADGGHEDEMHGRFNHRMLGKEGKGTRTRFGVEFRPGAGKQATYQQFPDTMARAKMVRTKKWKLVVRLRGGNELYDMENDRWEMVNLYGKDGYARVIQELQQKLLEWCLQTDTDRPYQENVGA